MTKTMTRTNTMAILAALMVMMICVTQVQARDFTVGASITVPLNMRDIGNRGTLSVYGEMTASNSGDIYTTIDQSVTTTDNSATTTTNNTTTNTTNRTTNNNLKVKIHNDNSVRVSGRDNEVNID